MLDYLKSIKTIIKVMTGRLGLFFSLFVPSIALLLPASINQNISRTPIIIFVVGYTLLVVSLLLGIMFVIGYSTFCRYKVTHDRLNGDLKISRVDGKLRSVSPDVIKFVVSPWARRLLLGYEPRLGHVKAEVAYQYGVDTSHTPWSNAVWEDSNSPLTVIEGSRTVPLRMLDEIDKSFQGEVKVHIKITQLKNDKPIAYLVI